MTESTTLTYEDFVASHNREFRGWSTLQEKGFNYGDLEKEFGESIDLNWNKTFRPGSVFPLQVILKYETSRGRSYNVWALIVGEGGIRFFDTKEQAQHHAMLRSMTPPAMMIAIQILVLKEPPT